MIEMSTIGRLLLLLAMLLMPLGMAPAAAFSMNHHATAAGAVVEHCPNQSGKHEHSGGLALCSMACASALPAQDLPRQEAPLRPQQLVARLVAQRLHSIYLEITTPPPKFA